MREVIPTAKFRRDLKKAQTSPAREALPDLYGVIESLADDVPLAPRLRDHQLTGNLKDLRECHIRPDLLLVYRLEPGILRLVRLTSHSDLFR